MWGGSFYEIAVGKKTIAEIKWLNFIVGLALLILGIWLHKG